MAEHVSLLKITFENANQAREWVQGKVATMMRIERMMVQAIDPDNATVILKPGWSLDEKKHSWAKEDKVMVFRFRDTGRKIFLSAEGVVKIEQTVGLVEEEASKYMLVKVFLPREKAFLIELFLKERGLHFKQAEVETVRVTLEEGSINDGGVACFDILVPKEENNAVGVEFWKMIERSGLSDVIKVHVWDTVPGEVDESEFGES